MPRYLVEVSEPDAIANKRINRAVSTVGSHFATHAAWRRANGVSTGSLIVDADDGRQALGVVPPVMRPDAHVFRVEAASTIGRPSAPSVDAKQPYALAA